MPIILTYFHILHFLLEKLILRFQDALKETGAVVGISNFSMKTDNANGYLSFSVLSQVKIGFKMP
jgi:hypothetical protein